MSRARNVKTRFAGFVRVSDGLIIRTARDTDTYTKHPAVDLAIGWGGEVKAMSTLTEGQAVQVAYALLERVRRIRHARRVKRTCR